MKEKIVFKPTAITFGECNYAIKYWFNALSLTNNRLDFKFQNMLIKSKHNEK